MLRLVTSRPGRIILLIILVIISWQAWLTYQATGKVPPDLRAHASARGTVDLRVTLRFPPERFHILTFQRFGRVSGSDGNAVEVRSVPVHRVKEIARFYWVSQIAPLPKEGEQP
ncbi:MAG: hypothetical protein HYU43_06875 [Armatimonadetes bacterium]|nr:hypothetical protein [Armatimonadota bacterium]MBI2247173.1 hypothetical protein [Armatimonadota bacterium]MBI2972522.1 hypothetical protein [Armatimonadota bacterium]